MTSLPLRQIVRKTVGSATELGKPIALIGAGIGSGIGSGIERLLTGQADAREGRYAAFISYCHRDMKVARWLHRAIETFRLPRALIGTQGEFGPVPARLSPVFRDEEELAGAAELGPKLTEALAQSRALLVICSPDAARSIWVDTEIRTFKTMYPDRPVFAVIAAGTPGSATEECFPPSLLYAIGADGAADPSHPLEPLAPDLRKLDRRTVRLKLIAGLAGIGYAALQRRDLRRRRRWMAMVGAGAATLIVILSALSIAAVSFALLAQKARHAAERAERRAVYERDAAVAARDLAQRRLWLAERAAEEVRYQVGRAERRRR